MEEILQHLGSINTVINQLSTDAEFLPSSVCTNTYAHTLICMYVYIYILYIHIYTHIYNWFYGYTSVPAIHIHYYMYTVYSSNCWEGLQESGNHGFWTKPKADSKINANQFSGTWNRYHLWEIIRNLHIDKQIFGCILILPSERQWVFSCLKASNIGQQVNHRKKHSGKKLYVGIFQAEICIIRCR